MFEKKQKLIGAGENRTRDAQLAARFIALNH